MKKLIINTIKVLLGIAIIIILLRKIGVEEAIKEISKINIIYLITFVLIIIATQLLSAKCLQVLFKALDKRIGIWKLIKYSSLAWVFALISPARIGELGVIAHTLKKEEISYKESITVLITDKLITAFTFFIMMSFMLSMKPIGKPFYQIVLLILLTILAALFIKGRMKWARHLPWEEKIKEITSSLRELKTKTKELFINFVLTSIKWIILFVSMNILLMALGQESKGIMIIPAMALTQILALIPISIGGLGIKESSGTYLLTLIGVTATAAASIMIINTIVNYTIALIYFLIFHKELTRKNGNH